MQTKYPPAEIIRRGKEIYERDLKPKVEAGNKGRILVIDVETGDYEIDDDRTKAYDRSLQKHPGAMLFGMRIGFPTAGKAGNWRAA